MENRMSYDPSASSEVADGSITTAKLGGDITALAKDLLTQATTDDAKTTLDVTDNGVPRLTL